MADRALAACVSIDEVEELALRRTPLPIMDFVNAGAGSGRGVRHNRAAFEHYEILPHMGRNVEQIDTTTEFLGRKLSLPLAIAPAGGFGLVRKDAELAAARAAGKAGILYCLSTASTLSLEEVAKACDGPKVFQLYPMSDKAYTFELIERARAAGYDALCLTVDTTDNPGRPQSDRWGDVTGGNWPPLRTILATARFPGRALTLRKQQRAGLMHAAKELADRGQPFAIRNDLAWEDWAELAQRWGGPFLIKGVLRPDDALAASDLGPAAIVVCNHGGTYMDDSVAPIDVTQPIADALPDSVPVIECGGIRTGFNLMTCLALGARLGMTSRPFMYGAAAAGEEGVAHVIELFRSQFNIAMRLTGCRTLADIDSSMVRRRLGSNELA